jgi:ribosomal protein S28E/S33
VGNQFARAVRAACAVERNVTGDARLGGTMVLLDNIVEIPAAAHFDELPLRILRPPETERTVTRNQPGNL